MLSQNFGASKQIIYSNGGSQDVHASTLNLRSISCATRIIPSLTMKILSASRQTSRLCMGALIEAVLLVLPTLGHRAASLELISFICRSMIIVDKKIKFNSIASGLHESSSILGPSLDGKFLVKLGFLPAVVETCEEKTKPT